MRKLKVMTVVGTRPEIIKMSRVIAVLDQWVDHVLVHTGQNYDYELNQIFFDQLDIRRPNHFLEAAGRTATETVGNLLIRADPVLERERPDAVLILGDTNSCLVAYAAKRHKIPIFHMEAGNRCFDLRVPEEINRRLVDHLSDINLTYSAHAREYLLREGIRPECVIHTGSPMREVLDHYSEGIKSSDVLDRLNLRNEHYYVVSAHREENVDSDAMLKKLITVLNAIAEQHGLRIIVSTHPRTRKRMDVVGVHVNQLVEFHPPLGFLDYVKLEINARAVLSDSGTITEESSILNFPALNLRETHERPEGMEEGAVMMTGLDLGRVMQGLDILSAQPRGAARLLHPVGDYTPDNVSHKILRIVLSYTDYVNRYTWKKC